MGLWEVPGDVPGLPRFNISNDNGSVDACDMRKQLNSSEDSDGSSSFSGRSRMMSDLLLLHADALQEQDVFNLQTLLLSVCAAPGKGNNPQAVESWVCGGFARGRLQQLMQQQQQQHSTGSSAEPLAAAAAAVQAELTQREAAGEPYGIDE
jgi:hypothetical protein